MLTSPTSPYVGAPTMISSALTNKMLTPCINNLDIMGKSFSSYAVLCLYSVWIIWRICIHYCLNSRLYIVLETSGMLHNYLRVCPQLLYNIPMISINSIEPVIRAITDLLEYGWLVFFSNKPCESIDIPQYNIMFQ